MELEVCKITLPIVLLSISILLRSISGGMLSLNSMLITALLKFLEHVLSTLVISDHLDLASNRFSVRALNVMLLNILQAL